MLVRYLIVAAAQDLAEAHTQLAGWRQSLLDLFGQAELLALPTMPVFSPRLADQTLGALINAVIEISAYTRLFNTAGTVHRPAGVGGRSTHSREPAGGWPAERRGTTAHHRGADPGS
jgi:hypothetical protein